MSKPGANVALVAISGPRLSFKRLPDGLWLIHLLGWGSCHIVNIEYRWHECKWVFCDSVGLSPVYRSLRIKAGPHCLQCCVLYVERDFEERDLSPHRPHWQHCISIRVNRSTKSPKVEHVYWTCSTFLYMSQGVIFCRQNVLHVAPVWTHWPCSMRLVERTSNFVEWTSNMLPERSIL